MLRSLEILPNDLHIYPHFVFLVTARATRATGGRGAQRRKSLRTRGTLRTVQIFEDLTGSLWT
jgi:hypothetical protein